MEKQEAVNVLVQCAHLGLKRGTWTFEEAGTIAIALKSIAELEPQQPPTVEEARDSTPTPKKSK